MNLFTLRRTIKRLKFEVIGTRIKVNNCVKTSSNVYIHLLLNFWRESAEQTERVFPNRIQHVRLIMRLHIESRNGWLSSWAFYKSSSFILRKGFSIFNSAKFIKDSLLWNLLTAKKSFPESFPINIRNLNSFIDKESYAWLIFKPVSSELLVDFFSKEINFQWRR